MVSLFRDRKPLEKDNICGCFYYLKIIYSAGIREWWGDDDTAVCPYCGIDSIIIEVLVLKSQRWF
ncbi:cytoplasmic protein [Bacillus cereus]|nr:cytoplasmic protein [Bacillus cereus]KAB2399835.1 cytoplasmic protein [Bacillus cereus]